LPSAIPVSILTEPCAAYDSQRMALHHALYAGGTWMDSVKESILARRPIERTPDGQEQYRERVRAARYYPRVSGLIDYMTAAVFNDPARVLSRGEDGRDYYHGLNDDADGLGTPIETICRLALLDTLLYGRAFLSVVFPDRAATASDPDSMHARIVRIPPEWVEDWDESIGYYRVHTVSPVRSVSEPWRQPETERHEWSIYTRDGASVYSADCKIGGSFGRDDVATLVSEYAYDGPSVFMIDARRSHIMAKLADPACDLYEREAAHKYQLDLMAFALMVLNLERNRESTSNMVLPKLRAMMLHVGESAQFLSPPASLNDPQVKAIEMGKLALYETIHALTLQAVSLQPQNARQSATAKELEMEPLRALLRSFAQPIIEGMGRVLGYIARIRGDAGARVVGLTKYEATMDDIMGIASAQMDTMPNGAQVSSATEIARATQMGELSPDAGAALLETMFALPETTARRIAARDEAVTSQEA